MQQDMQQMRQDMQQDMQQMRQDIRQDMQQMRQDIRQDMQQMRQDMREMRHEMNQWRLSTTRQLWMMVSVVTGAVLVGILKLAFFPTP
jgi:hypothetical protein